MWLVSAPADSAKEEQLSDLKQLLSGEGQPKGGLLSGSGDLGEAVAIDFPEFKVS